jgi:hypothetical protein
MVKEGGMMGVGWERKGKERRISGAVGLRVFGL